MSAPIDRHRQAQPAHPDRRARGPSTPPRSGTALALGCAALLAAAAPGTVSAFASFSAESRLELTLLGVTDSAGAPVGSGWSVAGAGFVFSDFVDFVGDADADLIPTLQPAASIGVGEALFQSSRVEGSAADGSAIATLLTDLGITVENLLDSALRFTFGYDALVSAAVTATGPFDAGFAEAGLRLFDDVGMVDLDLSVFVFDLAPPSSDEISEEGSFTLTLAGGGFGFLSGELDAQGLVQGAPGPLPSPGSLALVAAGVLGLGVLSRRLAM